MASRSEAITEAASVTTTSLAELSQNTLELYRQLLIACSRAPDSRPDFDPSALLDEYGRLRVWAEQTGITLQARGSLEDTLRGEPNLRDAVASIFEQIQVQLEIATRLVSGDPEPSTSNEDSDESFTSDSEFSEIEGSSTSAAHQRPRKSKLSLLASHISEQIGLLFHYSSLFRRPRLGGRYLHSKKADSEPVINYFDLYHIEQKLKDWNHRGDRSPQPPSDSHVALGSTPGAPETRTRLGDPKLEVLCMRLAAANSRRREQLRYWFHHPFMAVKPAEPLIADTSHPDIVDGSEAPSKRTNLTAQTFSSVAKSAIFETATRAGPSRTVYAESAAGDENAAKRVPKVPEESKASPNFDCPYCHMTLSSVDMQDRMTWKRHVYRDLRPYVCTFAKCANPDKLYATRRDWMYHETQMHRRQWNCRLCHAPPFGDGALMRSHVRSVHADTCDEKQLPVLLELSEGPSDGAIPQPCPFCRQRHTAKGLMEHIAGHLEEIALFVLPRQDDSEEPVKEESSGILSSMNSLQDDVFYSEETEFAALKRNAQGPPPGLGPTAFSGDHASPPSDSGAAAVDEDPRTFQCDQCGRVFDQAHKLNHHMRYHERPHECTFDNCGKRFGTESHLDRHIHDRHIKAKRYHCPENGCPWSRAGGKAFPRKDNLRRHFINKHTGAVWQESFIDEGG